MQATFGGLSKPSEGELNGAYSNQNSSRVFVEYVCASVYVRSHSATELVFCSQSMYLSIYLEATRCGTGLPFIPFATNRIELPHHFLHCVHVDILHH